MDNYSILDKVMTSKQQSDIKDFNPQEILSTHLKLLNSKEEDVLRRRFGLSGNPKETLEAIGKIYNVTRERIRQVENSSIKKIKQFKEFTNIKQDLENIIGAIIKQNGKIAEEDAMFSKILGYSSDNDANRNCITFIMSKLLSDRFNLVPQDRTFKKSWQLLECPVDFVKKTMNELLELIKNLGIPHSIDQLISEFKKTDFYQNNQDKLSDEIIISYANVSKQIDKNPFDEYGLREWGVIKPKRMNDKIYLVLKKAGKPMHFNKITELINKVNFDHRRAYPPTVHNELILNDRYVLVGRGIYALAEWGYKPGIVADVLVDILKKTAHPMDREQLVKTVLEQRLVKKNTVNLSLTDRSKFKKLPDGRYTLADGLTNN